MKKLALAVLTAIIAVSLISISCTKKEEDPEPVNPKTKTELLTHAKGWILTGATSDPAFETYDGDAITDLYAKGVINPWEKDDIFFYLLNGNLTVDPGKLLPPDDEDGYTEKKTISQWRFLEKETQIAQDPPFWYDPEDESEPSVLIDLTETTLKYKFRFDYEYSGSKKVYWWTYTFTAIK